VSLGQIHIIHLTGVKAFLIECMGGTLLVDTGSSRNDAQRILRRISEVGKKPSEINICIITHAHARHIGGLPLLKEICKFRVMAHEDESEKLREKTGVTSDVKLKGGEILPLCGGIRILHIPGHTRGSVMLYIPTFRALIAGDSLIGERGQLKLPPAPSCYDFDLLKASIKRLEELDFDIVFVSHGDDVLRGAKNRVLQLIREMI